MQVKICAWNGCDQVFKSQSKFCAEHSIKNSQLTKRKGAINKKEEELRKKEILKRTLFIKFIPGKRKIFGMFGA